MSNLYYDVKTEDFVTILDVYEFKGGSLADVEVLAGPSLGQRRYGISVDRLSEAGEWELDAAIDYWLHEGILHHTTEAMGRAFDEQFDTDPPTPRLDALMTEPSPFEQPDMVNQPEHYTFGAVEVIDAIEAWGLPYHLGNVVKYVARHERKGKPLQDLRKAEWYLRRYIETLENEDA